MTFTQTRHLPMMGTTRLISNSIHIWIELIGSLLLCLPFVIFFTYRPKFVQFFVILRVMRHVYMFRVFRLGYGNNIFTQIQVFKNFIPKQQQVWFPLNEFNNGSYFSIVGVFLQRQQFYQPLFVVIHKVISNYRKLVGGT